MRSSLGSAGAAEAIAAFTETMRRLSRAGVSTICYNFMPVVDWTRTELRYPMPAGGLALRFDMVSFRCL
jgi:mannonate dehydratase